MRDEKLLRELLSAESEAEAIAALDRLKLLGAQSIDRWKYLGKMPNNQAIVHNQQSTAEAALVEKYTNAVDAILIRECKARGIDPRSSAAPIGMSRAIDLFFGELSLADRDATRAFAEERLLLYATGSKRRPCLSLYDAGEGQTAKDFPDTFCSLIYGANGGSYKGAIPFVQGRFNMGGTGVLPFCGGERHMQLIVSRVPQDVSGKADVEWAFTVVCFFPSTTDPSWRYLVGQDGDVLTAGTDELGLIPKSGAKSGEVCAPRQRKVKSGTLIKMYDFKAPLSNVCGELFRKLEGFLLRPPLPLRIIECRDGYKANVMAVTVWDRLGKWAKGRLEPGFEEGASITIPLENGVTIPAEVRVFKADPKDDDADADQPQTGLRALINGQSHARRDAGFFKTKAVDKEHIAGSMLVTLDCTALGQDARNALFMSNREQFRDDPLLAELLTKLQRELHDHEGLTQLNKRRYQDKLKRAVDDDVGISALEELLATDPAFAEFFGSERKGKLAKPAPAGSDGESIDEEEPPFEGKDFPSFFRRPDRSTTLRLEVPLGAMTRGSFQTDVHNNYFTRRKYRGRVDFEGTWVPRPTFHLFNGRLTVTVRADKGGAVGDARTITLRISDTKGSGPFLLTVEAIVVPAREPVEPSSGDKREPKKPRAHAAPSRPDVKEVEGKPDALPLTIETNANTGHLEIHLNVKSELLDKAAAMRPAKDRPAVAFVFKYGLALVAMGLLERARSSPGWQDHDAEIRAAIAQTCAGVARVIVPLCLSLPGKLPKEAVALAHSR